MGLSYICPSCLQYVEFDLGHCLVVSRGFPIFQSETDVVEVRICNEALHSSAESPALEKDQVTCIRNCFEIFNGDSVL